MEPSVFLGLSVALFLGLLALIATRFARRPTDVVAMFALVFGLFYGFRPVLMAWGLDDPYPEAFFDLATADQLAARTVLWLSLFLVCFAAALWLVSERIRPRGTLFFAPTRPDPTLMLAVVAAVTLLASAISVWLLIRFGGVGGTLTAAKVDKSLAGLFFLKVPAYVGALVSAATFLQLREDRDSPRRRWALPALGCAVLNGFFVFLWGQRSVLVVIGVLVLLVSLVGRRDRLRPVRTAATLLLAAVVVIGISAGLRSARDDLIVGGSDTPLAGTSTWRQASIGTNSISFDASMLAVRDWPAQYPYRHGDDFVTGAAGFVPRALWSGKPEAVLGGKEFRQVYQPQTVNGWPVGTPVMWWLNFGPAGIVLGGAISGAVFGWIRRAQDLSAPSPLNTGIALIAAVYVFDLGVGPEWPVFFPVWLAPLWLVAVVVSTGPRWLRRRRTRPPAAAPPDSSPMAPYLLEGER